MRAGADNQTWHNDTLTFVGNSLYKQSLKERKNTQNNVDPQITVGVTKIKVLLQVRGKRTVEDLIRFVHAIGARALG